MELIKLTHENLAREHVCCAISGNGWFITHEILSVKKFEAILAEKGFE